MTVSVQLLNLLECSVLKWHPAGDIHVTCMREVEGGGGILLARGLVRSLLATGIVLESTVGMFFFRIQYVLYSKMHK